tara:strand:- start:193 stop:537 length:345 start_codon:yes stop_codon:yes gene_type:complete
LSGSSFKKVAVEIFSRVLEICRKSVNEPWAEQLEQSTRPKPLHVEQVILPAPEHLLQVTQPLWQELQGFLPCPEQELHLFRTVLPNRESYSSLYPDEHQKQSFHPVPLHEEHLF